MYFSIKKSTLPKFADKFGSIGKNSVNRKLKNILYEIKNFDVF